MAFNDALNTGATPLSVESGGIGTASITDNAVLLGDGINSIDSVLLSDGQLVIGVTGNNPVAANLTAGSGITITPASGSITIAASASSQWTSSGSDIYFNSGKVGIGTGLFESHSEFTLSMQSSLAYGMTLNGTTTTVDGSSNAFGLNLVPTFSFSNNTTNAYLHYSDPTFAMASGKTLTNAITYYATNNFTGNAGVIGTAYGYYYDGGGTLVGTVNTHYGIYIANPVAGTTKYCAYLGGVTIDTSQNIAGGTWHGSVVTGTYGGTGVNNGSLTITLSGGATNYVLTSDSSGNGTWSSLSAFGVSSITGTANQVIASASTGAITLSAPQDINVTSSPTFAKLGIGAGPLYPLDVIVTGTYAIGSEFLGTMSGQTGNKTSLFYLGATVSPSSSLTTGYAIRNETIFNTTSAVITTAYGNYSAPTKTGAGNLTNFYNGYFPSVSGATTINAALYAGDLTVGYNVTPPTSGGIMSGQFGLGTSSPDSNAKLHSVYTGGNNVYLTGTQTSKDSVFRQSGVLVENIFNPSGGTGGVLAAFNASSDFRTAGGQVSSTAAGLYVNNTTSSLFGDIQIVAGIYVEQGSTDGGVGLRYNNYGVFIKRPLAPGVNGTIALYTDDMSIGTSYYNITPPTSGAIIAGVVGCGTSSVNASAQMHLSSTTKGFLTTVMTTTQKNAISSPATLLEVGDSTLASPFWYNGSRWTNYNLTFATVDPWTAAFCGAA